jgi:DNA-directed RNA polymerase specialized sigma24 family protein
VTDRERIANDDFTAFVEEVEPRLRQALVALCGTERARDAVADGLADAWQHWVRVRTDNPAGCVYRVARSRVRHRRHAQRDEVYRILDTLTVTPQFPRHYDPWNCW